MYGFVSFRLILLLLSAACFYIWIPRAALLCPPCLAMPRAYAAIGPLATGLRTLPHVPPRLIGYLCVFIFIFGFYPVRHAIWIYDVCIMICTCVCIIVAILMVLNESGAQSICRRAWNVRKGSDRGCSITYAFQAHGPSTWRRWRISPRGFVGFRDQMDVDLLHRGLGNPVSLRSPSTFSPPFFNFSSSASYSTTCVLPTYLLT